MIRAGKKEDDNQEQASGRVRAGLIDARAQVSRARL